MYIYVYMHINVYIYIYSQTVYNTKGTRAHTHRELIRKWLWEPKDMSRVHNFHEMNLYRIIDAFIKKGTPCIYILYRGVYMHVSLCVPSRSYGLEG